MAKIKHAVVRTDNLGGTKNGEQLASVIFYNDDNTAEIDNGNIVVLGEKLGREAYKATAPAAGAVAEDLYVIAEEELFYDQTTAHYLTEWVNEAGKIEGTPEIGKTVGYTAGSTKIKVEDSKGDATFGTILEKETVGFGEGKYTYFYIGLK